MRNLQPNDVGHKKTLTPGELLAASAVAQFYNFGSRCMDWAWTTRSLQERAIYVQTGLKWLAAGVRLQTFLQLENSQVTQPASAKKASA